MKRSTDYLFYAYALLFSQYKQQSCHVPIQLMSSVLSTWVKLADLLQHMLHTPSLQAQHAYTYYPDYAIILLLLQILELRGTLQQW